MGWNEMMEGHEMMREDFERDSVSAKTAFKLGFEAGCKHGWREAMREAENHFGERNNMGGGSYGERDGYGERVEPWRGGFGMRESLNDPEIEHMARKIIDELSYGERRRRGRR